MKKLLSLYLTFILIFLSPFTIFATPSFDLQTQSIILMEANTGKILYEKNASQKMYPASTTKILTALVALELSEPTDTITLGREVYTIPLDASKAGHRPGDEIIMNDLLAGLLLRSGGDSALGVAAYIAKKETGNPNLSLEESIQYFAKLSNERAKEIGANNTHFVNPHGYHDENHYTTAYDLALITQEAMKNTAFRKIVKQPNYTIEEKENQRGFYWENRNLLLDSRKQETYYPYATGIKTGFTTPAGECLVASATKDDIDLIVVLLNSPEDQRWSEAKTLFEYGFQNFTFHRVVTENETVGTIPMSKQKPKGPSQLEVVATESFTDLFSVSDIPKIQSQIIWKEELIDPSVKEETKLMAPIEEKQIVGSIQYSLNNKVLKEIPVTASTSIEKRTIKDIIFSIQAIPIWIGIIILLLFVRLIIVFIKRKRRKKRKNLRFR
ncbi:MAG: D-alanyl-D-alanine carboxypeptidase [Epulopiscium sp.]|nr:D-alanyl-D-alanine carboxypeptidase [Candidatus Epulonipiscium sp.]